MRKLKNVLVLRFLLVAVFLTISTFVSMNAFAEEVDYEDVLPILAVGTDGTLVEKALVGKAVKAPTAVASDSLDGALSYTLRVSFNENMDITNSDGSLDYVLDDVGVYTFYYETMNSRNLYAFEKFTCDVRSEWLTINIAADNAATGYVGVEYEIAGFTVKNFADQEITDCTKTIEVFLGALKIDSENSKFTPLLKGTYQIIYKATKNSETATVIHEVEVVGSRPTITINNVPARGKINEEVLLPTAIARDSDGVIIDVTVTVTFGGKDIDVKDNKFTPVSVGKYIIKYSTKDKFNITNDAEFMLEAVDETKPEDSGCGSVVGYSIGGGALLLLGMATLALAAIKRQKEKNN